jgi:hydrogenase/urease accessory protein HupE
MKKKLAAFFAAVLFLGSTIVFAHPGHSDVAAVHGDGFGVWLMHQLLDTDNLLALVVFGALLALTGGGLSFRARGNPNRRRRLRG